MRRWSFILMSLFILLQIRFSEEWCYHLSYHFIFTMYERDLSCWEARVRLPLPFPFFFPSPSILSLIYLKCGKDCSSLTLHMSSKIKILALLQWCSTGKWTILCRFQYFARFTNSIQKWKNVANIIRCNFSYSSNYWTELVRQLRRTVPCILQTNVHRRVSGDWLPHFLLS